MKNVPLSVNEDVLASARRQAAKHYSTVNALVRQFLTGIAEHEDRAKKARAKLLSAQSEGHLGKRTWSREDLHAR